MPHSTEGTSHNESCGGNRDDEVNSYYMQAALLGDKITRGYPVADFIYAVWGFQKDQLRVSSRGYYTMDEDAMKDYLVGTHNSSAEKSAYRSLHRVIDHLVNQVRDAHDIQATISLVSPDANHYVASSFATSGCKPWADFTFSWLHRVNLDQTWSQAALFGELKKDVIDATTADFCSVIDISKIPALSRFPVVVSSEPVVNPAAVISAQTNAAPARKGKRKATGEPSSQEFRTSKRSKQQSRGASKANSIQSNASELSVDDNEHPAVDKLNDKELQLAKRANELGSQGIRSFASGFLIQDYDMTLWYIDRMGLVISSSFNFRHEPHFLVLFLAAISYASMAQLGFSSLLRFPSKWVASQPEKVFRAYEEVELVLPSARDAQGTIHQHVSFLLDVSDKRGFIPADGAVGRATVVFPVKPHNRSAVKIIKKTDRVVAKVSWPLEGGVKEDSIIRVVVGGLEAKESTKKYIKHIVKLKLSTTRTMEEMDLPRAKMFGLLDVDRRSSEDFMVVFVQVVKGHHAVHESSNVLHRDISVNNIMFYYEDEQETRPIGVLCDWDLAKKVGRLSSIDPIVEDLQRSCIGPDEMPRYQSSFLAKSHSTVQQPSGTDFDADLETQSEKKGYKHRTGTGPFIALDILLYKQVPTHLYRHDLESFFWVLVWFVASFNPDAGVARGIADWLGRDLATIGTNKVQTLKTYWDSTITQNVHPL
ncbi:hypothetical protein BXZ70DRAFT_1012361 [Cristinia sonorae]|uniref:Protein kinase domain-containing protein n=1 Tax=Cristinia sonorae TaxID=1940300 RepID=A0A8K0UEE5_9AGAR|nr:hypothetical protein BXZ70DRAFT_1012361 [Cristinia sonorae]